VKTSEGLVFAIHQHTGFQIQYQSEAAIESAAHLQHLAAAIQFEWADSNTNYIARHGVTPAEAEEVIAG
jgi:maltodextrin utilization protein YvdJ